MIYAFTLHSIYIQNTKEAALKIYHYIENLFRYKPNLIRKYKPENISQKYKPIKMSSSSSDLSWDI